jgi:hypothetical protein
VSEETSVAMAACFFPPGYLSAHLHAYNYSFLFVLVLVVKGYYYSGCIVMAAFLIVLVFFSLSFLLTLFACANNFLLAA